MSSPKKKVTLYFNAGMLEETQREALRQDRSISWIMQAAWRLAKEEVRKLPGAGMPTPTPTPTPTVPVARTDSKSSPTPRRATN